MRGFLANALVLASLLTPLCLDAQPRGAPRSFAGSGGNFRSFPAAPRRPVLPPQSTSRAASTSSLRIEFPPVKGTSLINPGESACLLNPSYGGSFYCRQYYSGTPSLGFEPVYPVWLPSGGYETEQSAPPTPEPDQDPQLAAQLGSLAAEVELLREDQVRRDSRGAPGAEPLVALEKLPTTLLVYRDGHQVEVQDYAIQGKMLWIFWDQRTRQVPLAELNLAATERVNGDRGVDFVAPEPR